MTSTDREPEGGAADSDPGDHVDRIEQAWRRERPDIDVSSVGIVTRVWRIGRHLEQRRKRRLDELGTDRITLDVLAMLRRAGPPYRRTAGDLMQSALITSGGMSQRLEKLENAGLISRHVHLDDRRKVDVQLTPEGIVLVDSVCADVMKSESELLDDLSTEELDQLRGLLRRLLSRFE